MRGQRHAPAALYPRERPGTRCTGGWVGPRAGLDRLRKSFPPTGIRSPDRPVAIPTTLPGPLKSCRYRQKHESVLLYELFSAGRHLLGVSFIRNVKSSLCKVPTTQNTTENNCVFSHAQNTTVLQPGVFLNGIHLLLVTNKGRSTLPSTNNFQGQLQTPQSGSLG